MATVVNRINPQYKDRLFRLVFGDKASKETILSLYNALNGTDYGNEEDLEITTLEDAIYIKMKNDVSLLVDSVLSLWEQQSTFNPNMPLRGLMYFGELYSYYVSKNKLNIYGSSQVKIPNPKYVVLYNGAADRPAQEELKLSSAFIHPDNSGNFEWTAVQYNLNSGKNDELLSRCKPLKDYMELINRIRENQKTYPIEEAVDRAVVSCIEDGVMVEFLSKHRAEVSEVCIYEYNEEVFVDGIREEGIQEGLQKGLQKGIQEGLQKGRREDIERMLRSGKTPEQIAEFCGYDPAEVKKVQEQMCVNNS